MTMALNQEGRPKLQRTGAQRRSTPEKKGAISPEKVRRTARPDTSNFKGGSFALARGWAASSRPASQLAIGDNARHARSRPRARRMRERA